MRQLTILLLSALFLAPAAACASLDILPHATMSEEYDSNISFLPTNAVSDWITRAQVGLDVTYEGSHDSVKFKSDYFYRFYHAHTNFDNGSGYVNLDVSHDLTDKDHIGFTENFRHGTDPSSLEDQFGRTSGRYTYTNNILDTNYSRELTSWWKAILRYSNEIDHYSREDISDNKRNTFGIGSEFTFSSTDIGLVDYKHTLRSYDPGGNVRVDTVTGGFRHYFTSDINLEAVTGYDFIRTINNVTSTDPVYNITLTDSITDKLEAKLSYLWENSTSAFSNDLFKNHRYSLGFIDQVNRRLKVDLQGFFGHGVYQQSRQKQVLKGASFGYMYELYPHWNLVNSISYTKQSSNVASAEYTRTFFSVGLRVEF
ncbi:MAG: hypothetical protein ACM3OC_09340 [Deltaproteobacteria bacterium]